MKAVATICILCQELSLKKVRSGVHFRDCGNVQQRTRYHYLEDADLIVVNFRNSQQEMDEFFQKYHQKKEKIFYLISAYHEEEGMSIERIQQRYRISRENIGVIPFDPQFRNAYESEKVVDYLRRLEKDKRTDLFYQNLVLVTEKILQKGVSLETEEIARKEVKKEEREEKKKGRLKRRPVKKRSLGS